MDVPCALHKMAIEEQQFSRTIRVQQGYRLKHTFYKIAPSHYKEEERTEERLQKGSKTI